MTFDFGVCVCKALFFFIFILYVLNVILFMIVAGKKKK